MLGYVGQYDELDYPDQYDELDDNWDMDDVFGPCDEE